MNNEFTASTVLIVGGSGSWGKELTRQLLEMDPEKIIIFSRGEISQVEMQRTFNNKLIDFVIGDARDQEAVENVFLQNNIDYVFHMAALKHVPICENQPWEAIQTNIFGVKNILDASVIHKPRKFVLVSTDKAVDPYNVYGLTKAISEKLVIQANCMTDETDFICIRSGNVLGTSGSLVPYAISQIRNKNEVGITDGTMTRFFTTFTYAVKFLITSMLQGIGGEIHIMNMPSFYISDVVDLIVASYGDKDTRIKTTGAREGEKKHELLISAHEASRTFRVMGDFVIRPQLDTNRRYYDAVHCAIPYLSSEDNLSNKEVLYELLQKGQLLKKHEVYT